MILDERGFDNFEDWAENASLTLSKYGPPPTIISSKAWREWAKSISQLPGISGQLPPEPSHYANWREWVVDFNRTVS